MKRKLLLTLSFAMLLIQLSFGQSRVVNGRIVSNDEPEGVVGATVLVKGTSNATQTNAEGRYSITVTEGTTLIITAIGYDKKEVTLGSSAVVNVTLELSENLLDEVVIATPYGSTRKSDFTGVATTVGADAIKNRPSANVLTSLQGAGPGIQTTAPAGGPGSSPGVLIRGLASYSSSNSPLYVVDGVEFTGGFSNLNPDDVESMTILKDASTIALYGSRGANGVVMITTKKGSRSRSGLNVRMQFGFNENGTPNYNVVNAAEYYELIAEAYKNNLIYGATAVPADAASQIALGKLPRNASGDQIYNGRTYQDVVKMLGNYNAFNVPAAELFTANGKVNPNAQLLYPQALNWLDESTRRGKRNEYNVNYNSGNDKTDSYISLNYLNEEGWGLRSKLERFQARVNVNTDIKKWLRAGFNISGNRNNFLNPADGDGINNPFYFARSIAPIYPVHVIDPSNGQYVLDASGNRIYDYGNLVAEYGFSRPFNSGRHALAETMFNRNTTTRDFVGARTYFEVDIAPWLTFNTTLSTNITNIREEGYENTLVGDGAPAGRYSQDWSKAYDYTFYQTLTAERKFGIHNFLLTLGHENFGYKSESIAGRRSGEGVENYYTFSNFTDINSLTSGLAERSMESYFMKVNYDLNKKYLFTGAFRRDGDSRMPLINRRANFWSLGVAWRLDQEAFFNVANVDLLKLRASYGKLGNSNVGSNYPYQAGYTIGRNNASEPGVVLGSLGSPSLKWEGQRPLDLGVDFSLYKGRITGTVDWFMRKSDGLLFNVQLPWHHGGTATTDGNSFGIRKNVGNITNKGLEVTVTGAIVKKKDFSWNMTVNFTSIKNQVTAMPAETPIITSGNFRREVGRSLYDYWTRTFYGVDPDNGRVLYKGVEAYNASNEDIKIIEHASGARDTVTYDHNLAKRDYIGKSSLPKGTGSIINNFSYKNFNFSFAVLYQFGGWAMDGSFLSSGPVNGTTLHRDLLNGWRNPGDITDIPRMDLGQTAQFGAASTRFLRRSDYVSLSNVSLSYYLPKALVKKAHLSNARVFVNGDNLFFITERKGMNTLMSNTGGVAGTNTYSHARILTLGIDFNL